MTDASAAQPEQNVGQVSAARESGNGHDGSSGTDERGWDSFENLFGYWKQCEKIAMHFNELIIGLRIKAIGALGVAVALGGALMKLSQGGNEIMGMMAIGLLLLLVFWIAIGIVDLFYYSKLLSSAVDHIEALEEQMPKPFRMEGLLSTAVKVKAPRGRVVYWWFYGLPAVALLIAVVAAAVAAG